MRRLTELGSHFAYASVISGVIKSVQPFQNTLCLAHLSAAAAAVGSFAKWRFAGSIPGSCDSHVQVFHSERLTPVSLRGCVLCVMLALLLSRWECVCVCVFL